MPKTAPAPVHGSVALFLKVVTLRRTKPVTTFYRVVPVAAEPHLANPAWHLVKPDGEQYTVSFGRHGAECTCPDFVVRRQNVDANGCKHVAGMRAVGLLRPLRASRKEPT